jgi:hypothetical protein
MEEKARVKKNKSTARSAGQGTPSLWSERSCVQLSGIPRRAGQQGAPGERGSKQVSREREGEREGADPSVGHLWSLTHDYVSCCRVPFNSGGSLVKFKV